MGMPHDSGSMKGHSSSDTRLPRLPGPYLTRSSRVAEVTEGLASGRCDAIVGYVSGAGAPDVI